MSFEFEELDETNFDETIAASAVPYLVDFWADWCAPCRAYEPIISEVLGRHDGAIRAGRVNIVDAPDLAEQCGIKTVPAVVLFRDGAIGRRVFGVRGERAFALEIENFLNPPPASP